MQINSEKRSPGLAREQARLIVACGLRCGLSLENCLRDTELSPENFYQFQDEVSVELELQLINNLLSALEQDAFTLGFEIGLECGLHSLGAIGHALLASESILEAVQTAQRYFTVAYHFVNFRLTTSKDTFKFCLDINGDFGDSVNAFLIARDIGVIANIHKMAFGDKPKNIKEFSFKSEHLPGMDRVASFFDCPVLVKQSENSYISLMSNLATPMPHANSVTADLLEQACYAHLDKSPIAPITPLYRDKVWLVLNDSQTPNITLLDVAKYLGVSERSLGRYLKAEKTSWNTIKNEYRAYKARTLLAESSYSVEEIALYLGYGKESNFAKAFQTSSGFTPSEFRSLLKNKP